MSQHSILNSPTIEFFSLVKFFRTLSIRDVTTCLTVFSVLLAYWAMIATISFLGFSNIFLISSLLLFGSLTILELGHFLYRRDHGRLNNISGRIVLNGLLFIPVIALIFLVGSYTSFNMIDRLISFIGLSFAILLFLTIYEVGLVMIRRILNTIFS